MTSHIVFDSSYVSDTWDWFESILIDWTRCYGMIPTLGHSHLRDCFFIEYVVFLLDTSHWGTPSLVRGWFLDDQYTRAYSSQSMMDFFFFWVVAIPRRRSNVIFHIGAWDMIDIFHLVYFTQGHPFLSRWWFWGIVVPWRWLDSFHIGVRDMIGWFLWCDHRSIAFSSLLTGFWDDWIKTQTLMRACSRV